MLNLRYAMLVASLIGLGTFCWSCGKKSSSSSTSPAAGATPAAATTTVSSFTLPGVVALDLNNQ